MKARRKRQFPRLAVYAVSSAELRRAIERVESLSAAVLRLETLVGDLQQQVDRLAAVPARSRRRPAAAAAGNDEAATAARREA